MLFLCLKLALNILIIKNNFMNDLKNEIMKINKVYNHKCIYIINKKEKI